MPLEDRIRPLSLVLDELGAANRAACQRELASAVDNIEMLLNVQHSIMAQHQWTLITVFGLGASEAVDLIASVVRRNFFLSYSALDQSARGFFVPARALLRPAFEGVLLAKYCDVSGDSALLKRWTNGQQINISIDVLQKVASPDTTALREFWRVLCQYAHATVYSQQLHAEFNRDEVAESLGLITMLLNMNGTLLSRHFLTRSMSRYAERYGHRARIRADRQSLRSAISSSTRAMTEGARAVVNNYRSTWILRGAR